MGYYGKKKIITLLQECSIRKNTTLRNKKRNMKQNLQCIVCKIHKKRIYLIPDYDLFTKMYYLCIGFRK